MLSKEKTRKAFTRAASQYDRYAAWQQKITRLLVEKIIFQPQNVLDLGCGTGEAAILLKNKFPSAEVHGIDLAEGMIAAAQLRSLKENKPDLIFKTGDMEHIDYPDESFDLVISSLSLQWLNSLDKCFQEVARVLKPDGFFLFSTVADGSQADLVKAYKKACGDFKHRHNFLPGKSIIKSLKDSGFVQIKTEQIEEKLYFKNFKELAYSIKNVGAKAQNAGILTRKDLLKLESVYSKTEHGLPLNYKIIIAEARKQP